MSTTTTTADSGAEDLRVRRIEMIEACKQGDSSAVRRLLQLDPTLVEFDNPAGRFAPLHYAVRAGHLKVVEALLEAGANPNPFEHMLRNHCGTTTIELARLRGYQRVVELLEAAIGQNRATPTAGSDMNDALKQRDLPRLLELVAASPDLVDATDDDGNTALHCAAEARPANLEMMATLIEAGANLEATNFLGFKPVHMALFRNHEWPTKRADWRAAGFLLGRGALSNICLASAAGDLARVQRYLEADATLVDFHDSCRRRPLSCAAEFGHWEVVQLLLSHGADPNAAETPSFRCYPLVMSVQQEKLDMVRLLLDHGANPEAYIDAGGGALYHALDKGNREIADLLASRGASLSPADYAWRCDLPVLSALLKANPALAPELMEYNDESKPEKSSLVIHLAFKHGADPKKVGAWTMYRATRSPELMKAFLEHGVDPNVADSEGKTTLHGINRDATPSLEAAGLLLDFGANIHARDDIHCGTPLTWAAIFGKYEMAELLLSRGALPNLPDDQPWSTPLFWARQRGHADIAALLCQHGATR